MQHEDIINCPITQIPLCYKTQITPEITNYMSFASGFWTNSLMKEGEEFYEEQFVGLPELYKEIAWKDPETELVWLPNTINEKETGMIFAQGPSKDSWGWMSVRAIKIPQNERHLHPIPGKKDEYLEYTMDLKNGKMFKPNEYMLALSNIGMI
jgi:hypothetical protein